MRPDATHAVFVHGVLLNGHLWRHQLGAPVGHAALHRRGSTRAWRHGDRPDQDVSVTANARMLEEFLDALTIEQVDLVGNDSGGGIAQIFAASHPERVRASRSPTATRTTTGRPRPSSRSLRWRRTAGCRATLNAMLSDKDVYRSPQALGPAYEHPERVTDESIEIYLRPLRQDRAADARLQRFLAAFDNAHTVAIEARLKTLSAPTLIVWGTDDVYFDVKWSRWLADVVGGSRARLVVRIAGAVRAAPAGRATAAASSSALPAALP